MGDQRYEVRGLPELNRAFRQVDSDIPKGLKVAFFAIAQRVVGIVQQRMPFRTGEAAGRIRARSSQKGAGIAFPDGGTPWRGVKADYYPWLDFGGTTGRGHIANGHNGFGGSISRPRVKGGRYIYPAIAESHEFLGQEAEKAIDEAAHRAGFITHERLL